jgi:hypothetical protein
LASKAQGGFDGADWLALEAQGSFNGADWLAARIAMAAYLMMPSFVRRGKADIIIII